MKRIQIIELAAGLIFLIFGFALMAVPELSITVLYWLLVVLASISTLSIFVAAALRKKRSLLIGAVALLIVTLMLYMMPKMFISLAFSLYMLFCAACYFIQWLANRQTGCATGENLISGCFYLVLWLLVLTGKDRSAYVLQLAIGCYFIYQGLQLLLIHGVSVKGRSWGSRLLDHWTSLPMAFVSFLPFLVVERMDHKLKDDGAEFDQCKSDGKPDLTVYIHTGTTGVHAVGHMTFCFEGLMYSYGNYAKQDEKLHGTLGPAVFFTVPPEIYINNSCIYEGTTLYGYGIRLTEKQKDDLRKLLDDLLADTHGWSCPLARDVSAPFSKYQNDYSSRLWWRTGAKFRKFNSGPWKTYWVMGSNCSLFAESVLNKAGIAIAKKKGIVSPGEYFEFFEELFADPNSAVICRQWHTARMPETLYSTWA